jgi:hypothetical protein
LPSWLQSLSLRLELKICPLEDSETSNNSSDGLGC